MSVFYKKIGRICVILLFGILFAGCGDSPQPALDAQNREDTEVGVAYRLKEQLLPDPLEALSAEDMEDPTLKMREEQSWFFDNTWYLLSLSYRKGSGAVSACIQILEPPYEHWESYKIPYGQLTETTGGWVQAVVGTRREAALLEFSVPEQKEHVLGSYGWDDSWEPLMELPESLNGAFWYQADDGLRAVSNGSRTLTVFDQTYQEQNSRSLSGQVIGILENPADGSFFWYGFEMEELVLWDGESGQVSRRLTDRISPYNDFCMAFGPTGQLLLADREHVWMCGEKDGELEELFTFMDMEYPIDKLYGCNFREDGMPCFFAEYNGEKYLLTTETFDPALQPEKQEITLAMNVDDPGIRLLAIAYNRQSENYHIRVIVPDEGEDRDDYHRNIQLEMAAGKGPDLLGDFLINVREAAANGYLEPLDGLVEDRSPFFESAFLTGQINGVCYGIPVYCHPAFLAVSRKITEADSWTLEEMMETVRNSPAEILEYGRDGVGIVMYYGLYDEENTALIDWENGESHLTEAPFLELMAFAKEYADTGKYKESELMSLLREGTIAGVDPYIGDPNDLNKMRACFDGEEVLIGYPRVSGNGIYMITSQLYMNRNSENKEGAADFLRYMLSEEGQRERAGNDYWGMMTVRRDCNADILERYQQSVMDPPVQYRIGDRYFWEATTLDEKQIEQYWWLMDTAKSGAFRAEELWTMVEEELEPYFHGDRSAEEAAAVLDSRVQLYLDERK